MSLNPTQLQHEIFIYTLKLNIGTFSVQRAPCSVRVTKIELLRGSENLSFSIFVPPMIQSRTSLLVVRDTWFQVRENLCFKVGAETSTTSLSLWENSCLDDRPVSGMRTLFLISISQPHAGLASFDQHSFNCSAKSGPKRRIATAQAPAGAEVGNTKATDHHATHINCEAEKKLPLSAIHEEDITKQQN